MAKNQRDFFKKKNEWSEIKDTLLRCYLPQYFLLVSGKPIFYIDCFAGKGKFDDGNDGSPLIAMQIINERLGMSRISRKNNAIVPCFIELNHAADLEQNLMLHPYQYGTPQVVDGKFEDNIRGLLKDKRGYNVFLYIDPYGIQALDSQLFDEIGTYGFRSFEMLINFNSFGFFRDACRVMKVDISQDDALMGLDDLVEYDNGNSISSVREFVDANRRWKLLDGYRQGFSNGSHRRVSGRTQVISRIQTAPEAEVQICVGHAHQTETWSEAQVPDDTCLRP